MSTKNPLVSVIIPMYNSAKFIPQTLESLLYQTMTDFEVIVIDDCSTDNSVEVVESFASKFSLEGGSLHVIKLAKNTGMPGIPRNAGIQFARGKYIAFLDSDDLYTKTALEELTTLAEQYQSDLVTMGKWFVLWENKAKSVDDAAFTDMDALMNPDNWTLKSELLDSPIKAPTLESNDIIKRILNFVDGNTFWSSWLSLYRRDLLISNQIFFPPMITSEDAPFVFACRCFAKRILYVPNATYIRRHRVGSVSIESTANINLESYFHKKISSFIEGTKALNKVMDEIDLFKKQPVARYSVLDFFYRKNLSFCRHMLSIYAKNPGFKLSELAKKEFHPDNADFTAYLFGVFYANQYQIMKLEAENQILRDKCGLISKE